jgi:hypothetical protein
MDGSELQRVLAKRPRVFVHQDIHRKAMKLIIKAFNDGKWPLIVDELVRLKAENEAAIHPRPE